VSATKLADALGDVARELAHVRFELEDARRSHGAVESGTALAYPAVRRLLTA